jgi:hypothetical protein
MSSPPERKEPVQPITPIRVIGPSDIQNLRQVFAPVQLLYALSAGIPSASSGSGVTAVTATTPLFSSGGATPNLSIGVPVPPSAGGTGLGMTGPSLGYLQSTGTGYRVTSSYDATILADNPIHYWPFNDTSGPTAIDYGSNSVNGTYHGTVGYSSGLRMRDGSVGVRFDGASTFITFPISAVTLPFTFEWVMLVSQTPSTTSSSGMDVWSNVNAGFTQGLDVSLGAGTGEVQFTACTGSGFSQVATAPFFIATMQPIHCIVGCNGSQMYGYIQGQALAGTAFSTFNYGATNLTFGIRTNATPLYYFNGIAGKFAVYNYVININQALNHILAM